MTWPCLRLCRSTLPAMTDSLAERATLAALALGASMRLTRMVVTDDVPGQWWIKDPLDARLDAWWVQHREHHERSTQRQRAIHGLALPDTEPVEPWWWRYREGLDCPFCIGFWIACGVTASAGLWGRRRWWRLAASALTLNEVAAHLGARLGDVAD